MKNLEILIQELCPDGVEFRTMEEIFEIRNGYTPSKNNPDFWESGTIPWFRMEDIRQNGRILSDAIQHITPAAIKGKGLFPANSIIIATTATIGEHALVIADSLANQRFTNLTVRKSLSACLLPKFVFYYMFVIDEWCKKNVNAGNFASVDMKRFKKLEFPLPPIEVQTEIVRILDKFTSLEAELEAELDCRKRQYEYYRDKLLSFDNVGGQEVEWKKMSEVGTFIRGNGLQKKDFTEEGVGCIHYGQLYTHYGTSATETITYCSSELAKKLRKAAKGDIVIATTSENVEDVCKAVAWLGEEEIAVSGDAFIYKHTQNPKYMAYLFQTASFFNYKKKKATGTKVIRLTGDAMGNYLAPIPSLEVQHRIVSILDRFESLTTSLQSGLPAEIAARRQQYEHYRDKLLTFKRKGVA